MINSSNFNFHLLQPQPRGDKSSPEYQRQDKIWKQHVSDQLRASIKSKVQLFEKMDVKQSAEANERRTWAFAFLHHLAKSRAPLSSVIYLSRAVVFTHHYKKLDNSA